MSRKHILYIFFFLLIAYLVMNTGLFSDDFDAMLSAKAASVKNILVPKGNFYFIDVPVMNYSHYIWYRFFTVDGADAVNTAKILYIILAFYLTAQFFKIFLDEPLALLASFLFIFFPSHDSTVYMFMCQYLTLSFAFYLYAFYLAHKNKLALSFLSGLVASFLSYGSPPLAAALFVLLILNKEFKKAAVIIVPNIIYSAYFIYVTMFANIGHPRTLEALSAAAVMKQYLLQVLTFIDAFFGPQMWLKIYYAFPQLSLQSLILGVILTLVCYKIIKRERPRYDLRLIASFLILIALSFLIFALTGRYPQLCFNIGNRVTIYGSLLVTYLIILLPAPRMARIFLAGLLIFTILGISDHWKVWNIHQQKVISNISANKALKDYGGDRMIYVSGNQYSKYGPVSHIEFMSEGWVPSCIFKLSFGRQMPASAINKRFEYKDGHLIDTKYNIRTGAEDYINVYDSEKDELFTVDAQYINGYIDTLPLDKRHWVQLINNKYLQDMVLKLMPRLRYAI